jgi:hypothetical protein
VDVTVSDAWDELVDVWDVVWREEVEVSVDVWDVV